MLERFVLETQPERHVLAEALLLLSGLSRTPQTLEMGNVALFCGRFGRMSRFRPIQGVLMGESPVKMKTS
jgi:hypothetical protein